jgi:hypothetical protein
LYLVAVVFALEELREKRGYRCAMLIGQIANSCKKCLKIPNEESEPLLEGGQTIQWPTVIRGLV